MLSEKSVKRPWVNFEAGAAWGKMIIPVCFAGLRKDGLPKPYSSLQAVDLLSFGDDEYLATSVAHHLNIRKPIGRQGAALYKMGLGGLEGEQRVKGEELAFDNLKEELKRQDTFRSIDEG